MVLLVKEEKVNKNELTKDEKTLLLKIFNNEEHYYLLLLKTARFNYSQTKLPDFEKQITFYEKRLVDLKSIQLKLSRLNIIFKD